MRGGGRKAKALVWSAALALGSSGAALSNIGNSAWHSGCGTLAAAVGICAMAGLAASIVGRRGE